MSGIAARPEWAAVGAVVSPLASHEERISLLTVVGRPNIVTVSTGCHYHHALLPALRRLDGVRLTVGAGGTTAEAYGLGSRLPATVRISLRLGAQLVEAGAPLTTHVERSAIDAPGVDVAGNGAAGAGAEVVAR